MAGRVPQGGLEVEVEYVQPELVEIVLANSGETDVPAEVDIEIACETENLVAGDGLRGFAIGEAEGSRVRLAHGGAATTPVIRRVDSGTNVSYTGLASSRYVDGFYLNTTTTNNSLFYTFVMSGSITADAEL